MIIGKSVQKIKKALCLFLFATLSLLASGCSSEPMTDPFEGLFESESSSAQTGFLVVIPTDCSAELLSEAESLAAELTNQTGLKAEVQYDNELKPVSEGVTELFVGNVNRGWVKELLSPMKKDDYLCRLTENGVLIAGKQETATILALQRFREEILPAATAESLMPSLAGFSHTGSYGVDSVTLNGFDLSAYTLLIPADASDPLRMLAVSLREHIAEKSGYYPDIAQESAFPEANKVILLSDGEDPAAGQIATITPIENGLRLSAADPLGTSVAARSFCQLLFADAESGSCHCTINETRATVYSPADYRVGTVLAAHLLPFQTPVDVDKVTQTTLSYRPDLLLCGPMDAESAGYLETGLSGYTRKDTARSEETALPSFDRNDSLTTLFQSTPEAGPAVGVYRVGGERDGFLLVWVSGVLTEPSRLVLPQEVSSTELPVVVLIHTREDGGSLSFTDCHEYGLSPVLEQSFAVRESSHSLVCYATDRAFRLSFGNENDVCGYLDLSMERLSVFS